MKRQLSFDFENEQYILKENGQIIFSIDAQELKFVSLDFYNGVYKGKSTAIELTNAIKDDKYKKGNYIFSCDIISFDENRTRIKLQGVFSCDAEINLFESLFNSSAKLGEKIIKEFANYCEKR